MFPIVGSPAPSFRLNAWADSQLTHLDSGALFRERFTVLLFYPLDFSHTGPREILTFDEARERFTELATQTVGISVDSHLVHRIWATTPRHEGGVAGIRMPLLADIGGSVAQAYGVKSREGLPLRALFVVDPDGVVQHATMNNLAVERSVDEVLRVIRTLREH